MKSAVNLAKVVRQAVCEKVMDCTINLGINPYLCSEEFSAQWLDSFKGYLCPKSIIIHENLQAPHNKISSKDQEKICFNLVASSDYGYSHSISGNVFSEDTMKICSLDSMKIEIDGKAFNTMLFFKKDEGLSSAQLRDIIKKELGSAHVTIKNIGTDRCFLLVKTKDRIGYTRWSAFEENVDAVERIVIFPFENN
ncbi:MAG: hypothetical protein RR846_05655 [Oscillospiraceae bacterium]